VYEAVSRRYTLFDFFVFFFFFSFSLVLSSMSEYKVVLFMGSSKSVAAPWENQDIDARLGSRVLINVQAWLKKNRPNYSVEVLDPRDLKLPVLEGVICGACCY
jgi:hypothetical protein